MKKPLVLVLVAGSMLSGCLKEANTPDTFGEDALSCIFGSPIADAPALTKLCRLAPKLIPIVTDLIGQREGAKRSGVAWSHASDAGSPADGGSSDGGLRAVDASR